VQPLEYGASAFEGAVDVAALETEGRQAVGLMLGAYGRWADAQQLLARHVK
jgi:hypothetical protein